MFSCGNGLVSIVRLGLVMAHWKGQGAECEVLSVLVEVMNVEEHSLLNNIRKGANPDDDACECSSDSDHTFDEIAYAMKHVHNRDTIKDVTMTSIATTQISPIMYRKPQKEEVDMDEDSSNNLSITNTANPMPRHRKRRHGLSTPTKIPMPPTSYRPSADIYTPDTQSKLMRPTKSYLQKLRYHNNKQL